MYGPVCTVVWEGEAVRPTPIPIRVASMIDSLEAEFQPDGGEGLAKRKRVVVKRV